MYLLVHTLFWYLTYFATTQNTAWVLLSLSLVSLTKNHMKNATLISKWLQQDTLIKIALGYGWILSVYSLITKTKSPNQKRLTI